MFKRELFDRQLGKFAGTRGKLAAEEDANLWSLIMRGAPRSSVLDHLQPAWVRLLVSDPVCTGNLNPDVVVVKSAEDRA